MNSHVQIVISSEKGNASFDDVVIKHDKLSDLKMIIKIGFEQGFAIVMKGLDDFFCQKNKMKFTF